MKKNKGLMKILTIISILLVSLVVFSGCGKEKKEKEDKSYLDPINSMMTALQNKDIDEYLKTVPAEYQEKMEENYSNYISYEEIEKEKMSDEDLKEEEEDYKSLLGDKADENKTYVTDGYKVKIKVIATTEDNGDKDEEMTVYVYKVNGKWYMSMNH